MAVKKSELYRSLWISCDELRGGMDASQYKDYVLTLLFLKYVSDKYAGKANALVKIPENGSFEDIVKLRGDKDIGEKINKVLSELAEANDLVGVIDIANFDSDDKLGSGREKQHRLSNLVGIFAGIDLSANRAEGDDLLGDAYEYLMRHFATESGKSKGQFYTPSEVSRVMARLLQIDEGTDQYHSVYDPACGSGSLLLKVSDAAPRGLSIFGQEMDNATWALCRMNMFLHDAPDAEILKGNSLADPKHKDEHGDLETFELVVANPPFSTKSWSNGIDPANDEYGRFEFGIHRGDHRPPAQPVLRHGHPRLHHRAGHGERLPPSRRVHDRREAGLHEGRQQEPPPQPGHAQNSGRIRPQNRGSTLLSPRAVRGDREERL
jgi:type I restriction enzyme M protein